jgi:Dihydrofolate reductase
MSSKPKIKMPSAAAIVARSHPHHVIGVENRLPWHLKTDLKHFRERTSGHAIIMGRKTFSSIGKPLPNRLNIVLTRQRDGQIPGVEWAENIETALLLADVYSIVNKKAEFFVIGGEQIYRQLEIFINKVYLTEVFANINGDAKFDFDFDRKQWRTGSEVDYPASDYDDYPFRITELTRRMPFYRYAVKKRFLGFGGNFSDLLEEYARLMEPQELSDDGAGQGSLV